MRTMGILGLDYCGSTVISNILSGLPGVVNVGESHWILDRDLGCRECGTASCNVFTGRLLSRLKNEGVEGGRWWEIISEETGAEIIVSSDKLPRHYARFGTPDQILFLYKDPRANIYSWCKRKFPDALDDGRQFQPKEVESGINWWLTVTENIVSWIESQPSEVAVMKLEDFASSPHEMIRGVSQWLGTEFDPNAIEFWKRGLHYIGGNHSVKRLDQTRHFYNRITKDERWKDHIPADLSDLISNSPEIEALLQRAVNSSNF